MRWRHGISAVDDQVSVHPGREILGTSGITIIKPHTKTRRQVGHLAQSLLRDWSNVCQMWCWMRQVWGIWPEYVHSWELLPPCLWFGSLGQGEANIFAASTPKHRWRLSKIEDNALGEFEMLHVRSKIYIKSVCWKIDEYLKCISNLI